VRVTVGARRSRCSPIAALRDPRSQNASFCIRYARPRPSVEERARRKAEWAYIEQRRAIVDAAATDQTAKPSPNVMLDSKNVPSARRTSAKVRRQRPVEPPQLELARRNPGPGRRPRSFRSGLANSSDRSRISPRQGAVRKRNDLARSRPRLPQSLEQTGLRDTLPRDLIANTRRTQGRDLRKRPCQSPGGV
jgi:hypothetical protein